MDTICVAITSKGTRCTKRHIINDTRCSIHRRFVINHGPNMAAVKELRFAQKRELITMRDAHHVILHGLVGPERDATVLRLHTEITELHARQNRDLADLRHRQAEEIRRTGVNPDAEAQARRRAAAEGRMREWRERLREIGRLGHIPLVREFAGQPEPAPPVERNLQNFVNDNQNVHTTEAVKQTKDIVEQILKIPVPEEYRWNMRVTSKTAGEIIAECGLTPHATCQLITQYSHTTSIYDIEEGIYGKVLDSVWQYIKGHADKACLVGILKQELEDNIGMCAQGNLSRICNVVAGFMDGVGSQESLAERLGRLLSPLMSVEDAYDRMHSAYTIMKENGVPHDEWETWAGPLVDEEVEDIIDLAALRHLIVTA